MKCRTAFALCCAILACLAASVGGCAGARQGGNAPPLLPEPVTSARSQEVAALLARGPAVMMVTPGGVTIMGRQVDRLLNETVMANVTPDGGETVSATGRYDRNLDSFRIRVEGLPANTVCRYTVSVGAKTIGPFHFITAIPSGDGTPFRFAAYGDTQGPWQIHQTMAQQMLSHGVRFVLHAGDLCGFFDAADPARNLRAYMPMVWTRGNHDFAVDCRKVFDIPRPWSSLECGSVRVLSLSCFEDWKPGSEQYEWLREQVERPWDGWTILLTHAPPFTVMGFRPNYDWINTIYPLLMKGHLDLILCGHEHNYVRTRPIALTADQQGAVEIVTGGGGGNIYGYVKELPFIATGRKSWHCMIFEVTPETLTGKALTPDGTVIDYFVIRKNAPQPDLILAPRSKDETWRDARAVRLPSLFRDGMVLQRGGTVPVWGWAPAGEKVRVTLDGKTAAARAGDDGRWQVAIAAPPPGGPYAVTVEGAGEKLTIEDVLVGDVWVCSGQSNMEWPLRSADNAAKEIAQANWPAIRQFTVSHRPALPPAEDVEGRWDVCTPERAADFSAVAYFFARDIHQRHKVPVGIIVNPWGGQRIQSFISREGYEAKAGHEDMVQLVDRIVAESRMDPAERKKKHEEAIAAFNARAEERSQAFLKNDPGFTGRWFDPATDVSDWPEMDVPRRWDQPDLVTFDGTVWCRRDLEIPAEWAGQDLTLELGPIDDLDVTYFNGSEVGRTGLEKPDTWNAPRRYKVPGQLVRSGRNTIVVRVADTFLWGGIWGEPKQLRLVATKGAAITLAGRWKYRKGLTLNQADLAPPPPPGSYNHATPTALYGGMVAPLIPYRIRGVLWYQGESNAAEGHAYREHMRMLIRDWRRQWGQGDFPFLLVQLANFQADPGTPSVQTDLWPEVREAQLLALAEPNTAMAVAIDIGDSKDIHPRNKQEVGRRLALAARRVAYGEQVEYSGPTFRSMVIEGDRIRLRFDNVGGGLAARGTEGGVLRQLFIAGEDRKWVPAEARIDGETVVVWSDAVPKPVAVRYAWLSDPVGCNLYNRAGLPASPFRTDDWPLQSQPE